MARSARIVIPGLPHHITQRGTRRLDTFFSDADYSAYLALLTEACEKTGVACWAYCLMPNHVHLILVPPEEDTLGAVLGVTHSRYTKRVNRRENWHGHLWQERFHSFAMDDAHLLTCARYIEQNPVKAGLTRRPENWRWSSARAHLSGRDDALCQTTPLLERVADSLGMDWRDYLIQQTQTEILDQFHRHNQNGFPLGDRVFLDRLEKMIGRNLTLRRVGRPRAKIGTGTIF